MPSVGLPGQRQYAPWPRKALCDHGGVPRLKIRHNPSVGIAALVACVGATVLLVNWYVLPVLLIPAAVAVWGFRSGTDVDEIGLHPRALLAARTIPWDQVASLEPDRRGRLYAVLTSGKSIRLPAAGAGDAARIIAAGGQKLVESASDEG